MTELEFWAPGVPKPQPRPRAVIRGAHAGVYDPGTATVWREAVKAAAAERFPEQPFTFAVAVTICFVMPRPKAHRHKDGRLRVTSPMYHSNKPDIDQLIKSTLDALTDIGIWTDDCLVARIAASKQYGDKPGALIGIREVEQ